MRRTLGALVVAVSAVAVLAGCSSGSDNPIVASSDNPIVVSSQSPSVQGFTGATFQPAKVLPNVTLTDTSGRPWNLAQHGQGEVTVVYFGYTNCPDACPTDMAALGKAVGELTAAQQQRVQIVFVTVDPRRDKPAVIRRWLDRFDKRVPAFVGLTGSARRLTEAANELGLQFRISTSSKGLEQVEHSSQMTAFGPSGQANLAWLDPPVPSGIAHDIGLLLSGVSPT
jgi:protein SCO1/2